MATTTDSELRANAEKSLAEAQAIIGPSFSPVVVGDDYWQGLADRAKEALKKAAALPFRIGGAAGEKIREAARSGLNAASEASSVARKSLQWVAMGAALLALAPLLVLLAPVILMEGSGFGPRARRAGKRYVNRRAREFGI
jgi:hypothetical protein